MSKLTVVLGIGMSLCMGQPDNVAASEDERELHRLVNEYRQENGLPQIPLSKSLTHVAQVHVADLVENTPDTGSCNMHSWSDQPVQSWDGWTPCCYTPDHAASQCMWDKPGELTNYPGNGYENSYTSGNPTPQGALNAWTGSPAHNDVILNNGSWANITWRALGVGMNERYGVLWFGSEEDPSGNVTFIEKRFQFHRQSYLLSLGDKRFKLFRHGEADITVWNLRGQSVEGILSNFQDYVILDFRRQTPGLYWVKIAGSDPGKKLLVVDD